MSDSLGNPTETQEYFERYLSGLPSHLRDRMRKSHVAMIQKAVSEGSNPDLEVLLPPLRTIQSSTILAEEYPPIPWIIPDYLPTGLTFLFGKPKVGKSWLALQLAYSVFLAGKMFGKEIEKGAVLYLALEDNKRRLQDRMRKQQWPTEGEIDFMLSDDFREQIGTLNSSGGKRLLAYIESKRYRLVIVDTFSRAVMGDQLKADEMTAAIGPIQSYAMHKNVAIIIIDHEPKNGDSLFGSVAKFGILDTSWRLYKEQGKFGAKLDITGRDVMEHSLKLVFDTSLYYWHCEGEAQEIERTERQNAILDALRTIGGRCQVSDIVEMTGQPKPHVHGRLQDLVNRGEVNRFEVGSNVYYEIKIDGNLVTTVTGVTAL